MTIDIDESLPDLLDDPLEASQEARIQKGKTPN